MPGQGGDAPGSKILVGRCALVTGGARRIGKTIALALASQGADVAFTWRNSGPEAESTLSEIRTLGVRGEAFRLDLSDLKALPGFLRTLQEKMQAIDILVNNASEFQETGLEGLLVELEERPERFDYVARLHVGAPLILSGRLGLAMKKRGRGDIVNVTDALIEAGRTYSRSSLYQATKAGLAELTRSLALALAPEVRVNAVAPGFTLAQPSMSREEIRNLIERTPAGREAGAEEIARDVLHLLQSESKTGSTIVSDGGLSLGV